MLISAATCAGQGAVTGGGREIELPALAAAGAAVPAPGAGSVPAPLPADEGPGPLVAWSGCALAAAVG